MAVSDAALASLMEALNRNSLGALDQAASMSAGLQQLMGAPIYTQWRDLLENLDFAAAAASLRQYQRS